MQNPVNLMEKVWDAVFLAMQERIPPELGGAYGHVLEGTKPPINYIADIALANDGTKHEQADTFVVEIHSIYRGADRRQLIGQAHAVRVALEDQPLDSDDADLRPPEFLDSAASAAGADGQTYVAVSHFKINAEPA